MATIAEKSLPTLGPICNDQTYPLEVFKRLAGLSAWAMRSARRDGLKVRTVGKRRYVRGIDWAEYLAKQDS